tara:strand:- start:19949 stop:21775 length:1827 start_codon:yes stop_codon:yes gene_type:complete
MLQSKPLKRFFTTLLIALGLFVTVKLSQRYGLENAYSELAQQSQSHLDNLTNYIESILGRYEKIPALIARHPLLSQALLAPDNIQKNKQLNLLLADLTSITQSADIFLINTLGITVAASNWQKETSFINQNFSFRPYFIQAMNNKAGRYYAVGVSSNKRGYYFSYPVKAGEVILGVIVVKISIDTIEQQREDTFGDNSYHFLITAPDGVIFIADRSDWQLKKLGQLPQENNRLIKASKRYGQREISALTLKNIYTPELATNLQANIIEISNVDHKERYFAVQAKMPNANWKVHIWSNLASIEKQNTLITLFSISIYFMALVLILFMKERIKNGRQLKKYQQLLELKVEKRTADLTTMNQILIKEIAEREKTERTLNETQEELIQSAKLATIGNMSASINHEIKQPLTALRSYAQNTLAFQARNMHDKAAENIKTMLGLIDRLTNIVSQFKHFTKKSHGLNKPILVHECLRSALSIVENLLHQTQYQLNYQEDLFCLGDEIRLEQVFVNLFTNALQAMEKQQEKSLTIEILKQEQYVVVLIRDNGSGILADNFDKIFQPFFSTNESFGLGLGLSISQRIIESMQGELSAENHELGGAEFKIKLPLFQLN